LLGFLLGFCFLSCSHCYQAYDRPREV
jgi:hypothetical protein